MSEANDTLIKAFSDIDSYLFKYKKSFVDNPKYAGNVDDKEHIGVMAQELLDNPITKNAVVENDEGYLLVDTQQLTMTLCAIVSNLAKKVIELEEMIKGAKENE